MITYVKMDTSIISSTSNDFNIRDKLKQILNFLKDKREDLIVLKAKYLYLRASWEKKEAGWNAERCQLHQQIDSLKDGMRDTNTQLQQEIHVNKNLNIKVQTLEEEVQELKEQRQSISKKLKEKEGNETEFKRKLSKLQHSSKRSQAEKCILLRKCMDLEAHEREITLRNARLTEYASKIHDHNQALHQACEQMFSVLNRLQIDSDGIEIEKLRSQVESLSHSQETIILNEYKEQQDDSVAADNPECSASDDVSLTDLQNCETLSEFMEDINSSPTDENLSITEAELPTQFTVSQVFLRLHSLTLQKNALMEELEKYKAFNVQLQKKVWEREQKILTVKEDLQTTWGLVSKLKEQHDEIHTFESVQRYDLQEKRLLLNRLKEELQFSREQWKTLQQKNDASALEWQSMREEFARRRQADSLEDASMSTEDSCQSPQSEPAAAADSAVSLDSDDSSDSAAADSNVPLIYFALVDVNQPVVYPPTYLS